MERETGFFAIVARPPLQVTDQCSGELLSADRRARTARSGSAGPMPPRCWPIVTRAPATSWRVEARRFAEAEVLQALIDSARLTTVVADDGQMMTELSLSIRNNGRQHLEIELPEKTKVWSAFVAGEPVRPSLREGKLLLPLERDTASDAPVNVELTFVGQDKFPRNRGTLALVSPKFDLPMKNAHWDLILPPDYDYSRFEGSMVRAAAATLPMEHVFSLSEYNVQQRAQEEQSKIAVRYGLENARKDLAGGNLQKAVSSYGRAKFKGAAVQTDQPESRELKELEQDVRRAQGSNLIMAQNNYFLENAGRIGDQQALQLQAGQQFLNAPAQQQQAMPQGGRAANLYLNYDADVANLQWDKLEKAQQVAVAKVAPLHVNLPTHGVRYSFSQVLQTELRKPMTIRLLAENTKVPSWTTRFALALGGFAVLWAIVAVLNRRRSAQG